MEAEVSPPRRWVWGAGAVAPQGVGAVVPQGVGAVVPQGAAGRAMDRQGGFMGAE